MNKKKRIFTIFESLALCFACVFSTCLNVSKKVDNVSSEDESTATKVASPLGLSGDGTEESPYLITSSTDLTAFSTSIKGGETFSGKYLKVTSNIDLGSGEFSPISSSSKKFEGTLDGSNCYITGMSITSINSDGTGFFARNDGTIKNLTVTGTVAIGSTDTYTDTWSSELAFGGICGYNYGTISNCAASVTFMNYISSTSGIDVLTGGSIGANYGTATKVTTSGGNLISFQKNVSSGTVNNIMGGVAGRNGSSTYTTASMTDCNYIVGSSSSQTSYFDFSTTNQYLNAYFGGIAGECDYGVVTGCHSNSFSFSSSISSGYSTSNYNSRPGGIVGSCTVAKDSGGADVNNCTTANGDIINATQTGNSSSCSINTTKYYLNFYYYAHGEGDLYQLVASGGTPVEPSSPSDSSYVFKGWYTDTTYATLFSWTSAISANAYPRAKWAEGLDITYDSQGGSTVASVLSEKDQVVTKPTDPTKDNYTFGGWYKEAACTTAWDFDTDVLSATTTLYAKWVPVKYTVTFEPGEGSSVDSMQVDYGSSFTAPSEPTLAHYDFAGWFKDSEKTTEWNFETDIVEADITLYAKWTIKSYTITFNSNGGTEVTAFNGDYGTLVTKPTDPTKEHYVFIKWCTDTELTTECNFTTYTISDDATLYAKWDKAIYTIAYNTNGGSEIASTTAEYLSTITKPTDPTKKNYLLNAWFTDEGLSTEWNFDTDQVTDNMTLYAGYNDNYTHISFVSYNEEEVSLTIPDIELGTTIEDGINEVLTANAKTSVSSLYDNNFYGLYYVNSSGKPVLVVDKNGYFTIEATTNTISGPITFKALRYMIINRSVIVNYTFQGGQTVFTKLTLRLTIRGTTESNMEYYGAFIAKGDNVNQEFEKISVSGSTYWQIDLSFTSANATEMLNIFDSLGNQFKSDDFSFYSILKATVDRDGQTGLGSSYETLNQLLTELSA